MAAPFDKMVHTLLEFLRLGSRLAPATVAWRYSRTLHSICTDPFLSTSVPEHYTMSWPSLRLGLRQYVAAWFVAHPDHVITDSALLHDAPYRGWENDIAAWRQKKIEKAQLRQREEAAGWTAFGKADANRFTPVLYTVAQIRSNAWATRYDRLDAIERAKPYSYVY
jgi:hypothetical protein